MQRQIMRPLPKFTAGEVWSLEPLIRAAARGSLSTPNGSDDPSCV
jgi:hypothetical protein